MKFECNTGDGSSLEAFKSINDEFIFDAKDGYEIPKVQIFLTSEKVQEMIDFLQSELDKRPERKTEYTCIHEPTDKMLVAYRQKNIKFFTVDGNVYLSFADARQLAMDILSYVNEPPEEVYQTHYKCALCDDCTFDLDFSDENYLGVNTKGSILLARSQVRVLKESLERWLDD